MGKAANVGSKKENHLTIPQLDSSIEIIKRHLYDESGNIREGIDAGTASRMENLLLRYTTAKNKINKYYNATMKKHPNVVRGRLKLLTVIDTMKWKDDAQKKTAQNTSATNQDKSLSSFIEDHKGLIVGASGTAMAIIAADALAKGITTLVDGNTRGIFKLVAQGLGAVTEAGLLPHLLTGLGFGALILIATKINPALRRARAKKLQREQLMGELNEEQIKNEDPTLEKTTVDAAGKINLNLTDEEISRFVENPDLLKDLEDKVKASGTKNPLELAAVQKLRIEVNSRKAKIDAAAREAEIEADKQNQAVQMQNTIDKLIGDYAICKKRGFPTTTKEQELLDVRTPDGKKYFESLVDEREVDIEAAKRTESLPTDATKLSILEAEYLDTENKKAYEAKYAEEIRNGKTEAEARTAAAAALQATNSKIQADRVKAPGDEDRDAYTDKLTQFNRQKLAREALAKQKIEERYQQFKNSPTRSI